MREKNNILKMFFHSPKQSPQEMALSSSNSKDIIKDHHTNLTLYPLVENPSSFASSTKRSEKDNSIFSQEIKAKPRAKKTNNYTYNLTEQKNSSKKDRSEHSANKISKEHQQQQRQRNNNNKVILHNRTQKKNHQMMQ